MRRGAIYRGCDPSAADVQPSPLKNPRQSHSSPLSPLPWLPPSTITVAAERLPLPAPWLPPSPTPAPPPHEQLHAALGALVARLDDADAMRPSLPLPPTLHVSSPLLPREGLAPLSIPSAFKARRFASPASTPTRALSCDGARIASTARALALVAVPAHTFICALAATSNAHVGLLDRCAFAAVVASNIDATPSPPSSLSHLRVLDALWRVSVALPPHTATPPTRLVDFRVSASVMLPCFVTTLSSTRCALLWNLWDHEQAGGLSLRHLALALSAVIAGGAAATAATSDDTTDVCCVDTDEAITSLVMRAVSEGEALARDAFASAATSRGVGGGTILTCRAFIAWAHCAGVVLFAADTALFM